MKIIISTTGTSLFSNIARKDKKFEQIFNDFIKNASKEKEELIKKYIKEVFRQEDKNRISAEINSLSRLSIEKGDKLYFLSTATPEGRLSAEIIARYFEDNYNSLSEVKTIEKLQVKDPNEFEKEGIKNLVDNIISVIELYPDSKIILNPTGGFKGVVPYVTLIGMVYKKEITYIHENINSLITLPLIPLEFDYSIIDNYVERFDLLEKEGCIKSEMFYDGISFYDREAFKAMIIEENGYVTLSAIGEIIYKKFKLSVYKPFVMISSAAIKKFNNIEDKKTKKDIRDIFQKLLNPQLRLLNMHNKVSETTTDCYIYKEKNSSNRAFYYLVDDTPKVVDFFTDHDKYENKLDKSLFKDSYGGYRKFFVMEEE